MGLRPVPQSGTLSRRFLLYPWAEPVEAHILEHSFAVFFPTPPSGYSHGYPHDLYGPRAGNRPVQVYPNHRWQ